MNDQETTDPMALARDLNRALPLLARDALAAAVAAGTMNGPEGVALAPILRDMATSQLRDLEAIAARVASLGATPEARPPSTELPPTWREGVDTLAGWQHETLEALVDAIPADADDAEGEATEHLLEHVVARTRGHIEVLERALR